MPGVRGRLWGGGLMKRTYRISVTVEAAFNRKVNARAHRALIVKAMQRGLGKVPLAILDSYKVVGSKVTSKAASERAPKLSILDPAEPLRDAMLVKLQVHADAMARLLGNVKKPRLRRWPNSKCGPQTGASGRWDAHAHVYNGVTWQMRDGRGVKRLGNLYGTVCVKDRWLDSVAAGHEDGISLLAHEIAHLRVPSVRRHAKRHEVRADDLERAYREVMAGARQLPEPRAFPKRAVLPPSSHLIYETTAPLIAAVQPLEIPAAGVLPTHD